MSDKSALVQLMVLCRIGDKSLPGKADWCIIVATSQRLNQLAWFRTMAGDGGGQCAYFIQPTVLVNSLLPSDAIWRHRSGSTLAQTMAYCLLVLRHYLNQCWLLVNEVQWQSPCQFHKYIYIHDICIYIYFSQQWLKLVIVNRANVWVYNSVICKLCTLSTPRQPS